jgi:hypothetical protein
MARHLDKVIVIFFIVRNFLEAKLLSILNHTKPMMGSYMVFRPTKPIVDIAANEAFHPVFFHSIS